MDPGPPAIVATRIVSTTMYMFMYAIYTQCYILLLDVWFCNTNELTGRNLTPPSPFQRRSGALIEVRIVLGVHTLSHSMYGSTLKNLTLTFCPNFFPDTPTCIVTPKQILRQKPYVKFGTLRGVHF